MGGGFSFCGRDIATLQLQYAPENKDTYVYNTSDYEAEEQSFNGHDGGYFYGINYKPKNFTLRCFYEDVGINTGLMANIDAFFYKGRTGRLVFDKRPWLYYNATVISVDYTTMYSKYNGLVVIRMKAYYPFAVTDYIGLQTEFLDDMLSNSALIDEDDMPETEYTITGDTDLYLYNGGTRSANVTIDIGGVVGTNGLTIGNVTNKTDCKFIGLNSGGSSKYVELNGRTGNCYWVSSDAANGLPAFLYHDHGFITLEPSFPHEELSLSAHTSSESPSIIHSDGQFTDDMIDRFVKITYTDSSSVVHTDELVRITNVIDANTAIVAANIDTLSTTTADLMTMNRIHITTSPDVGEVYIKFKYKHTFS